MSTCSICYDDLCHTKGNYLRLECNHEFHFKCIFQLLSTNSDYNNRCPMCRDDIIKECNNVYISHFEEQVEVLSNKLIEVIESLTSLKKASNVTNTSTLGTPVESAILFTMSAFLMNIRIWLKMCYFVQILYKFFTFRRHFIFYFVC